MATLLAAQAGVRAPEVVTVGLGPDGDALHRHPATGRRATRALRLPIRSSDEHARGPLAPGQPPARGRASPTAGSTRATCSSSTTGRCWSTSPRRRSEPPRRRSTSTWPSCSSPAPSSSGPSGRSARPSRQAGATPSRGHCPYLQRAALTPHLRDLARSHEVGLKDLRERPRRPPERRSPRWRRCAGSPAGTSC